MCVIVGGVGTPLRRDAPKAPNQPATQLYRSDDRTMYIYVSVDFLKPDTAEPIVNPIYEQMLKDGSQAGEQVR